MWIRWETVKWQALNLGAMRAFVLQIRYEALGWPVIARAELPPEERQTSHRANDQPKDKRNRVAIVLAAVRRGIQPVDAEAPNGAPFREANVELVPVRLIPQVVCC